MKMTNAERLLAIMLAEIMERLEIDNGEIDPAFVKKMVINHDEWALDWQYGGAFHNEDGPSDDVVNETAEIMSMMSFIEHSIAQLPADERDEFEDVHPNKFLGFDGNSDPHYGVARTLIEDLGRFSEFNGRNLNSHGAMRPGGYLTIKPAYDREIRGLHGRTLSADQLRRIIGSERYS